jgi:hypothetical protein
LKIVYGLLLSVCVCAAQQGQSGPQFTDVYHVHFAKAAPGKAVALADYLKTQDPKAPMKGHYIVLRHQEGSDWDYAAVEHMGTKATIDLTGSAAPVAARDAGDWHEDTYVVGPPWAAFASAMGLNQAAGTAGSVYVVSVYRAVPGHREELVKVLSEPDRSAGGVLLQHLEGGAWNYLSLARHASWQEFAKSEEADAGAMKKNTGGWFDLRNFAAYHNDTLADRLAP